MRHWLTLAILSPYAVHGLDISPSYRVLDQLFFESGHWFGNEYPVVMGSSDWDQTLGYWQEANLVEGTTNYLLLVPASATEGLRTNHTFIAAAVTRSFASFPAFWLINNDPEDTSYDDLLWWSLSYLRAHELCLVKPDVLPCAVDRPDGSTALIEEARTIFDFVWLNSWSESTCGGGFGWSNSSKSYKNCVTNSQAVLVANKLALLLHANESAAYAQKADIAGNWIDSASLYTGVLLNDGVNPSSFNQSVCPNSNATVWTYCQGLALGFGVARFLRSRDYGFLNRSILLAQAVHETLSDRGVLYETGCDEDICAWFGPSFPRYCGAPLLRPTHEAWDPTASWSPSDWGSRRSLAVMAHVVPLPAF
jgi:predicted alpha-1,6-mannanase (GH76 family)